MEKEQVKQMQPQKTWFFTDSSGRVFPTNEKEAFNLLTENSRWRRQDIKMVGVSDGTTYYKTITGAGAKTKEIEEQLRGLKATLNKYIAGHDKLLFEDFVEETDPRLKRAKELIDKTEKEIQPLEDELKDMKGNLLKKAFDAEYEVAKGNIENPRDFSVIVRGDKPRNPQDINDFISSRRRI